MNNVVDKPIIILIGGSGFLGSHLYSNLICQGYIPMQSEGNLTFLENNYPRSKFINRKVFLISMAWSSNSRNGYLSNPDNAVWATKHIDFAKFCMRNDYCFVIPGTCLEYTENQTVEYIKSKIKLKKFVEENMSKEKYLWLRYFYVFSLVHRRPSLIRDALAAKSASRPLRLSNIDGRHDYIEVRDAVAQTIELIEGLYDGVWDIGAGCTRSNRDLISRIGKLDILENKEAKDRSNPRIVWEGSAKKLIPNHAKFTTHTNHFFGNL